MARQPSIQRLYFNNAQRGYRKKDYIDERARAPALFIYVFITRGALYVFVYATPHDTRVGGGGGGGGRFGGGAAHVYIVLFGLGSRSASRCVFRVFRFNKYIHS